MFNNYTAIILNSDKYFKILDVLQKYTNQSVKLTWIYSKNMTEEEKKQFPEHETAGGFLRKKTKDSLYNGKEVSSEDKAFLESLPNFCPKILKECTGIDLTEKKIKITIGEEELEVNESKLSKIEEILNEE
jgi:hypothetical protein